MAALETPTMPLAPPPDLQLYLVPDTDDMLDENMAAAGGPRRPSTASLSRFRSCPQLAALNNSQDSTGSDMAPMTDIEGNILHTEPSTKNSLYVDQPSLLLEPGGLGVRSAANTPTPPSTPGSCRRRRGSNGDGGGGGGGGDPMASSFTAAPTSASHGGSPCSTPKLQRRFKLDHEDRTYSADAARLGAGDSGGFDYHQREDSWSKPLNDCFPSRAGGIGDAISRGLSSHNFRDYPDQSFDDASMTDDGGSSMHVIHGLNKIDHNVPQRHHLNIYQHDTADNSAEKCSRWLQSMKLSKADKVKSRSHIQLPPV